LAYKQLYWYERNRTQTNFNHFYVESKVEAEPKTVTLRKQLAQAEQLLRRGEDLQALRIYLGSDASKLPALAGKAEDPFQTWAIKPKKLEEWKAILLAHRDYRRDLFVQEEAYKLELRYSRLIERVYGKRIILPVQQYQAAQALAQPNALLRFSWVTYPSG